jgi:hypothetical protein
MNYIHTLQMAAKFVIFFGSTGDKFFFVIQSMVQINNKISTRFHSAMALDSVFGRVARWFVCKAKIQI